MELQQIYQWFTAMDVSGTPCGRVELMTDPLQREKGGREWRGRNNLREHAAAEMPLISCWQRMVKLKR